MTGWRIGYAGGPEGAHPGDGDDPVAVDLEPVLDHASAAAVEALNGTAGLPPERTPVYRGAARPRRLDAQPGARASRCPRPEGAFYVYPSCAGAIGQRTPSGERARHDEDFVTALLEDEGVAVVHGSAFGLGPYFRISYATSTDVLEDACRRIQRFCAGLR